MKRNPISHPESEFPAELNPCPECKSTNLDPQPVANRHWRGWRVECLDCGDVMEYDEPEEPVDYRRM